MGAVEGIYAFIYCKKWRFGQVLPMPYGRTHWQTLKDRATQLLIKYKSGALVTQYPKSLKEISRVLKIHYACLDGQLAIWFDFQERKKWFPLENKVNYEMNHSWSIYLSFKTFPKSALTAWKVILPDEMFRASIELKNVDSFLQTCCVPSMFSELFWLLLLAVHKNNILLTFFQPLLLFLVSGIFALTRARTTFF